MGFERDDERDARFARAIFLLTRFLASTGNLDEVVADEMYGVADEMAAILVDLGHDDPRQFAAWE